MSCFEYNFQCGCCCCGLAATLLMWVDCLTSRWAHHWENPFEYIFSLYSQSHIHTHQVIWMKFYHIEENWIRRTFVHRWNLPFVSLVRVSVTLKEYSTKFTLNCQCFHFSHSYDAKEVWGCSFGCVNDSTTHMENYSDVVNAITLMLKLQSHRKMRFQWNRFHLMGKNRLALRIYHVCNMKSGSVYLDLHVQSNTEHSTILWGESAFWIGMVEIWYVTRARYRQIAIRNMNVREFRIPVRDYAG